MSRLILALVLMSTVAPLPATYLAGTRTVDSDVPHRNCAEVGPGVRLANGSLAYYQTDLETKGRVLGLRLYRVWRSDMTYDGPFGQGWTCEYTQAGWKDGITDDIHWHDADGFLHTFYKSGNAWVSPPGVYAEATYSNGVRLRMRDGSRLEFNAGGQITAIIDRSGNSVTLDYDAYDRLETITDDRGLEWELVYDGNNRVIELIDHVWETATRDPRSVEYEYDTNGNLIAVYMPETARYSDSQSNRVTWEYDYDGSDRLTDVYAPNEVYTSGTSVKSFAWESSSGRVVSFRDGHSSAEHYLRYTQTGGGAPLVRHIAPHQIRTDFELDTSGRRLRVYEYTAFWDVGHTTPINHAAFSYEAPKLRASDPSFFLTEYTYSNGHEVTCIVHPADNEEVFSYPDPAELTSGSARSIVGSTLAVRGGGWTVNEFAGGYLRLGGAADAYEYYEIESNTTSSITVGGIDLESEGWGIGTAFVAYDENPDPLAAGNLLEHRHVSSDQQQTDVVQSWTYEPYFQQVRSATSERGYVTTWEFGFDTSGDPGSAGAGNITNEISPVVTVIQPDGSTSSITYETEYTYNSYGQLAGVVDPEGGVEVRNYYSNGDQLGFLEEVVTGYGELDLTTVYEYDKTGLLTGHYPPRAFAPGVDTEDFKTTWQINELGQTWHEAGPEHEGERVEVYRYFDASGNEVITWREYVTADGDAPSPPTNEHNPATFSRSSTAMEETWVETARTFDISGRVLTETFDAEAGSPVSTVTWEYEYDEVGNQTARISPLDNAVEFEYDERYLVWTRTEGAGSLVEATYETDYTLNGDVKHLRTPLGNETEHTYDGHGRLIRTTDAEGHYQDYEYDAADNVIAESTFDSADNLLAETNWTFDQLSRPYIQTVLAKDAGGSEIGAGERVTRFTLDGRNAIAKRHEGGDRTWLFDYDEAGRLVAEEDPFGNTVELTLDLDGNVTRRDFEDYNEDIDDFETAAWEADYNTFGLPIKIRDRRHQGAGFDTEVEQHRDGWGRLVETVDAAGAFIEQDYDLRSLPTETREGSGLQLSATRIKNWDDDGRNFGVDIWENESGTAVQETEYDYDERNRLTLVTHPDQSTREFEWDDDSNLQGWTDETATYVEQTYDDNGRVTEREITLDGGTLGTDFETFEYDGAGRLMQTESFAGEQLLVRAAWTWNTLSRAESTALTLGDGNDGTIGSWTTTCEFDVHGTVVNYGYSDGEELDVARDVLSRVSSVIDASTTLAAYSWAGSAREVLIELGNGVNVSLEYETGYSPLVEDMHNERGTESLWRIERRFDERGLLSRERRDHQGATGRAMVFDATRQLTDCYFGAELAGSAIDSQSLPTAFGASRSFDLDMRGNRSGSDGVVDNTTTDEIQASAYTVSSDAMNRYTSVGSSTRVHDDAARLVSDSASGLEYVWDYRSRLIRMDDPQATTQPVRVMYYDGLGTRAMEDDVTEGVLNRRTILVHAPDGTLLEKVILDDEDEEVTRVQYAPGAAGYVAERVDGEWVYLHHNQDGSLIGLTDDNGKRIAEFDYLPFGAPVRTKFLLDAAASEVSSVFSDTPAAGTTRVTLSTALTSGALAGYELALSLPGESSDRYRSGAISANGTYTIDVADPDDLIYDALQSLGSGFVVLEAKLTTVTPSVTYDSQTDLTRLTVSGAGFSTWLAGGWLIPDVNNPSYLRIVAVDSSGDWVQVHGDATSAFEAGSNYRALPPVGAGLSGFDDSPGARHLWRGMRHDYAARLDGWPGADGLLRSGLYSDSGRSFDPSTGHYLTPGDPWPNPYGLATNSAGDPAPGEKALAALQRPVRVPARREYRCDAQNWREWSE